MKIDWKRKLSSRKFWGMVAALLVSIVVFFVSDQGTVERITSIITSAVTICVYIWCEATLDESNK
jgi:uncharacterized membrane protein YhaH (DUF805 family)